MEAEIAVTAVLRGQRSQTRHDGTVVTLDRPVLLDRARQANDPAAPAFAETQVAHEEAHD
jgi:hypothetical protein